MDGIYDKSFGVATRIRNHRDFGLIEMELEPGPDHSVVWLKKIGGSHENLER